MTDANDTHSSVVSPQDIVRLQALCGMLSSSSEQERATAARKASDLLARIGIHWGALVALAMEARNARSSARETAERVERAAAGGWNGGQGESFRETVRRSRERALKRRSQRYLRRYGMHIEDLVAFVENNASLMTPIEQRLFQAACHIPRTNGLPEPTWVMLKGMYDGLLERYHPND